MTSLAVPVIETPRLILRGWRPGDVRPYAAMLADPAAARFITRGGRPHDARQSWAEAAFMAGHWQLRGYGMFVVEERETGAFVGRVGPLRPEGWPALEIAWAVAPEAQGRGYATEAARAATEWTFATLAPQRIVSLIHAENAASRRVAEKLGERRSGEIFSPLGEPCEVWEMGRVAWSGSR
ncbi:MAG TPA: GNAT family N-acetyltransferase [Actinomycetota bacterium]